MRMKYLKVLEKIRLHYMKNFDFDGQEDIIYKIENRNSKDLYTIQKNIHRIKF